MSSIPSIGAQGLGGASSGAGAGYGDMSSEDFMNIMFTELQNQDPFKPNDSAAMLEQLNSIRSIESDMQLTQQLQSIVTQNQLAGAGNLIGRFVEGIADGGVRVAGQVMSVVRQGDLIGLELDNGWIMDMNNVEVIVDQSIFGDPASGGSGSGWDTGIPDMNGDGTVDGSDLSLLLGQWNRDG
ncbi:MAG: flagellar hook capping FlgD N-terminal domain-containing protein [Phycisphaerales bacterium]|nr:flagellar hook capping FlgD N-terminal domain-containing protein [Phycisphaerales bacterium]